VWLKGRVCHGPQALDAGQGRVEHAEELAGGGAVDGNVRRRDRRAHRRVVVVVLLHRGEACHLLAAPRRGRGAVGHYQGRAVVGKSRAARAGQPRLREEQGGGRGRGHGPQGKGGEGEAEVGLVRVVGALGRPHCGRGGHGRGGCSLLCGAWEGGKG
jgi:hypothetical protein